MEVPLNLASFIHNPLPIGRWIGALVDWDGDLAHLNPHLDVSSSWMCERNRRSANSLSLYRMDCARRRPSAVQGPDGAAAAAARKSSWGQ